MTLQDYNSLDNKESFCYWLEHKADDLGRIKGNYSSMYGVWQMKKANKSLSNDYKDDGNYKWLTKYNKASAEKAFSSIRNEIVKIIECAMSNQFHRIDDINYNSLPKWKIAFIYSDYRLLPVYSKSGIRDIARNFEHPNYDKALISELNQFILSQKDEKEDIFDFGFKQYHLSIENKEASYYIIGSKYKDENDNDFVDVYPAMYMENVVSTGFFRDVDLSHLYGEKKAKIDKWFDKNLKVKDSNNFANGKTTLARFLNIKKGDIIAVKSHGRFNKLTIIAYAEVIEIDGYIYSFNKKGLGHCLNVSFLETDLSIETGLNYSHAIHRIIPDQREGHFEKIFGSYALNEVRGLNEIDLKGSRINEKKTGSYEREVSYTATIEKTHDKLQLCFAHFLQEKYPNDIIVTESKYIDVVRQNDYELFYYEVKPFNSAYNCIRSGVGQLLDYSYSNPHSSKKMHLRIVGSAEITIKDQEFIDFLKNNLNLSFDYISYKP